MKKTNEWKLEWNESEDYIIFKLIDENGLILKDFSLQPPDHAKLYYALADWYGDTWHKET